MLATATRVLCLVSAMLVAPSVAAQEATAEVAPGVWETRPFRISVGMGYPHALHLAFAYAPSSSWRVIASYVGLAPFTFGGGLQLDYLLTESAIGKNGFSTVSVGIQSMVLKYNFAIVDVGPNDVDWGIGPELAFDVGVGWFSAGIGVGVMVGDWRSLKREIGDEVTPSEHVAISFSLPRLSVNW